MLKVLDCSDQPGPLLPQMLGSSCEIQRVPRASFLCLSEHILDELRSFSVESADNLLHGNRRFDFVRSVKRRPLFHESKQLDIGEGGSQNQLPDVVSNRQFVKADIELLRLLEDMFDRGLQSTRGVGVSP